MSAAALPSSLAFADQIAWAIDAIEPSHQGLPRG